MFHVEHQLQAIEFDAEGQVLDAIFKKHQEKLEAYLDLLTWWNNRINLVSRNVSRETLRKHVLHSLTLTLVDVVQRAENIIDTGTGGGLPGLPLAIALPQKNYVFNDIVSKKITAVRQMAYKLGVQGEFEPKSIKDIHIEPGTVIVSKHAFKIAELCEMVGDKPWSSICLLKGYEDVEGELEEARIPLKVGIIKLDSNLKDEFFSGKGIVILKKLES